METSEYSTTPMHEYVQGLKQTGDDVVTGLSGTYWRRNQVGSLMRMPPFSTSMPDPKEIQELLWRHRCGVATYLVEPDASHQPNAILYKCHEYCIEKLHRVERSNIRKANRFLTFGWMDTSTFLAHGFEAFRDTRQRNGISGSTPEIFAAKLSRWLQNPANHVAGAWNGDVLVAFYRVIAVDDWVEFGGCSTNSGMVLKPNNGLVDWLLTEFLVRRGFRTVSYGVSSIQEESKVSSLHQFKTHVGFEAIPVHRVFALNPLLRPAVNRLSLAALRGLLNLAPGNSALQRGYGVLAGLVRSGNYGA